MPRRSPPRSVGRPARLSLVWLPLVLLAGCLPELAGQCSVHEDCPADRPLCISEVCTPTSGSLDRGPDGLMPDDAGADRGVIDAGAEDAGDGASDQDPTDACAPRGPEVCNGLDDDCDGQTDEVQGGMPLSRPCYTGLPETQGQGACRAGRATCTAGAYGACVGEVVPMPEVCTDVDPTCGGLCNGDDDDCDGLIDEGLMRPCGPPDEIGLCRRGVELCGDGFWQECEGVVPPAIDICDGDDNDCDLSVDEGDESCECAVGESQPCYSGAPDTLNTGVCSAGFQDCTAAGVFGRCLDQITPLPERCDGADNDCDDRTDERLGGQPCPVGIGACRRVGTTRCDSDAAREICDAVPGDPADAELCNGIDDDCDTRTDEGFGLREPCARGVGECQVVGERVCADDGRAACDAVAGDPRDEVCNGRDDDCDGTIDEGPGGDGPLTRSCYDQPGGNPGVGACVEGIESCEAGRWSDCVGDQRPFDERCNQIDDDCNGEVDDVEGGCSCTVGQEQPCYGGPDGTRGVGPCRGGTQRCAEQGGATGFGPCMGEVLPGDEACNGADDDCDGMPDEGTFGQCASGVGACAADGQQICRGGALTCDAEAGLPTDEICNGVDDDCDGVIDDIAGAACAVGVGACQAEGVERCDGDETICDGAPGQPTDEVCNGVDDDCDGTTDEAVPREACTVGTGACARAGVVVCRGGVASCDGRPGGPGIEMCNGIDDDCDGSTDEGTFGACMVGVGACARPGQQICVAGMTECRADEAPEADEQCNGEDDDCDGQIDEQPDALCVDPDNATGTCMAARCALACDPGFSDRDMQFANGCERGCGAPIAGAEFDTDGVALAVAARPEADEFAIVWLDDGGSPHMSINGGAPFDIDGPDGRIGYDIQLVGVRGGYSALLRDRGTAYGIDVRVVGGAPVSIQVFGGDRALDGVGLPYRDPQAAPAEDDVPLLMVPTRGGGQLDVSLFRVPRTFGAEFGVPAPFEAGGAGWLPESMSATTVEGRALVVGVTDAGAGQGELRAIFVDGGNRLSAPLGALDNTARTAVGARGSQIVVSVAGAQAVATYGFEAEAGDLGAPLAANGGGVPIGVQFGPAGPVVSGVADGSAFSIGLEWSPQGLVPIFGPQPIVSVAGGSGGIPLGAATITTGGRRIVAWRDQQRDVHWGENPCR